MFNIFGSDKKSSTTNTTTNYQHTDESTNAGGAGSIAAGTGANVSIMTSDPEVVARALDTTSGVSIASLNFTAAANRDVLDFAARANASAAAATDRQLQQTAGSIERIATLSGEQISESRKDPDNATLQTVAKYGATAAVVLGLGVILFALTRKR